MSDFLISLNKEYTGKDLLRLIKKPYGKRSPEGLCFDFPWGAVTILQEGLARNKNIITKDKGIFAWVGDLVTDLSNGVIELFVNRLTGLQKLREEDSISLQADELFRKLNGGFAAVFANATGFCIVTDPLSFIPVYVGRSEHGELVSCGTHPDIVASIGDPSFKLDLVSVAEFLNGGNCAFPNTMHRNVKEMEPGRAHIINIAKGNSVSKRDFIYWLPPEEICQGYNKYELAKELESLLLSAVERRCRAGKVAVLLSGGLDSRMIMAAVPESVDCIGLTFCEGLNRESKIANRVAKCYNRQWFPLFRSTEFLGNSVVNIVKFVGCEFQWVDAHNGGFVDEITKHGADVLLSGMLCDGYLKGYLAHDFVRIKQLHGIIPSKHEKRVFDYADNLTDFWRQHFCGEIVGQLYERRANYYERNMNQNRSSVEWLNVYPFSQDFEGAYWVADRRVLPIRLVAMDRDVLDFAFRCPVELKVARRIFLMAALGIYGSGASIPCADNGVRPSSGALSRRAQFLLQKSRDRATRVLEKLGKKHRIQGSWHDQCAYEKYWKTSHVLEDLRKEYAAYLDQFNELIFKRKGRNLLYRKDIGWSNGFRLLQLAIWQGIIREYGKN